MSADTRTGPFWDAVAGRVPMPPAARTLGCEMAEVDPEAGTVRVAFEARPELANPTGAVQGVDIRQGTVCPMWTAVAGCLLTSCGTCEGRCWCG